MRVTCAHEILPIHNEFVQGHNEFVQGPKSDEYKRIPYVWRLGSALIIYRTRRYECGEGLASSDTLRQYAQAIIAEGMGGSGDGGGQEVFDFGVT